MHESTDFIEKPSYKSHFWCKFTSRSIQHNFFAARSATANVFWKSQKPGRRSFWGGRAECAGALGGDLRGVRDLQIWDLQFRTSGFDLTRQRLPYCEGGGFNRSVHSAGPILNTQFYPIFDPHAHRQIIDMVIWSRTHQSASNLVSFIKNWKIWNFGKIQASGDP